MSTAWLAQDIVFIMRLARIFHGIVIVNLMPSRKRP